MQDNNQIDVSKIKTYSIKERENLVKIKDFARVCQKGGSLADFLDSLPTVGKRTNAAQNMINLIERINKAKAKKRAIIWGIGPHVIKYGLSPLIIDLMEKGLITGVALNGAGAIHDTEIALIGETSEEMGGRIQTGQFGMAHETGELINGAARDAYTDNTGFGYAIGRRLT